MAEAVLPSASWLRASTDLLRALNDDEPLDTLLHRVARYTCELLDTDACSVMLLDETPQEGRDRLVVRASHALTEIYRHRLNSLHPLLVHPEDPGFDVPAAQALREGRTVVLSDVREWPGALGPSTTAEGIRSVLAMPLGTEGEYTGVLIGYTNRVRRFTAAELALAELMTQFVAVVLKTAASRAAELSTITQLREANDRLTAVIGSLEKERERREWAESQDRNLVRLLLDDVGLDGVLAALAEALGASVVLENPDDGSAIGRHPASAEILRLPDARHGGGPVDELAAGDAQRVSVRVRGDEGRTAWIVPVTVAGEFVARLWVIDADTKAADAVQPFDRSVIERFSLLVALELLKRRYAVDTELRLTRDLAVELVGGSTDVRGLVDRGRVLGHDLSKPHIVVRVPPPRTDRARPGQVPAFRRAAALHAALSTRLGARVLVGEQDGALVVLVPAGPGRRESLVATLRQLPADRDEAHVGRADLLPLPVLVGPTVHAVEDYPRAWRTVHSAAALAAAEHAATRIVDLDELGVAALLLEAGTPESLRRLADRRLGPLENHDRVRDSDLVETLRTWLRVGCSTAETARVMHVHPHTVSYRLRRVAALSGLDPQHNDGVFELRIAVMVRAVQRAIAPMSLGR